MWKGKRSVPLSSEDKLEFIKVTPDFLSPCAVISTVPVRPGVRPSEPWWRLVVRVGDKTERREVWEFEPRT